MRIIFAGTPEFAAAALAELMQSQHEIMAVLTQPDRPAGRGLKLKQSPVKELAWGYDMLVRQPLSLSGSSEEKFLIELNADVMVVAAYGLLLPASILAIPKYGCINIHPSLLPRWRGAAPIPRTIEAGDSETGVTIMQMDQGLDTGPILLQRHDSVSESETAETLHDRLAALGAKALIEALDLIASNKINPVQQDHSKATYAHKITKGEALIDWMQPAIQLERKIRAFNPWPIAYTTFKGERVRIFQAKAKAASHNKAPRTIIRASGEGIDIAAKEGILRLQKMQLPGGKLLTAQDFYNAHHQSLIAGEHFV